eukprot:jgi/Psemu1/31882/gm1.31882_g
MLRMRSDLAAGTTAAVALTTIITLVAWNRNRTGNRRTNRTSSIAPVTQNSREERDRLKAELKSLLSKHNGCTKNQDVVDVVEQLAVLNPVSKECYKDDALFQGEFFTLSAPPFPGKIENDEGLAQFTLGRLSFNIFQPAKLVCTINSIRNPIIACTTKDANEDFKFTYDILIDITIHTTDGEEMEAIMTNKGFCRPSSDVNNRIMVTFTGSSLNPKQETNSAVGSGENATTKLIRTLWTRQFENAYLKADRERSYFGWTVHYGLKWFMGLVYPTDLDGDEEDQNSFHFEMKKPLEFYLDVLYLDEEIRITKGSRGTIVIKEQKKTHPIPSIVTINKNIMSSSGGRKPGCGNYTKAELESMFAATRAVVPVSTDDWDDVRALHAQKYPGKDVLSICNKFHWLYRKKAPTGNPSMRWDISEKSEITGGEDRYDIETKEFTPPPAAAVATQPVPLLLGQPTQPTQPLLLGQPTQPPTQTGEGTQFEEVTERTPTSAISSSKKKRHYNCKGDNEFKMMIAEVLKLQQKQMNDAQRRQERADEERKVLL